MCAAQFYRLSYRKPYEKCNNKKHSCHKREVINKKYVEDKFVFGSITISSSKLVCNILLFIKQLTCQLKIIHMKEIAQGIEDLTTSLSLITVIVPPLV